MRKKLLGIACIAVLLVALSLVPSSSYAETLSEKIGVAHTRGKYCFTDKPFLIEGAEQIQELGSKVIKVFLQDLKNAYPHNSVWSEDQEIPNIVDVLKTDYFKELFEMDFKTFILQASLDTVDDYYWRDGLTNQEWWKIEQNYYDAAIHLFRTYAGRELTFILEHWETEGYYGEVKKQTNDWNPEVAQQGLIDYFNARAEGVKRARLQAASEGISGVTVQTAVEIIYISTEPSPDIDGFRVIDHMDEFRADAIAYSVGSEGVQNMQQMVQNIQTLVEKSGGRPWYIGEFQATETRFNPSPDIRTKFDTVETRSIRHKKNSLGQIDAALRMGAEYVILWEIYHNENTPLATNMDGYGLIREDGTKTALAEYLPSLLTLNSIPSSEFIGRDYIESLAPGSTLSWFYDSSELFANGATTTSLAKNVKISRGEGLVMHTVRYAGNRPGDSKASKGEPVTFWVDGQAGMSFFLMETPTVPKPSSTYSDSAFRARKKTSSQPEIPGKFPNGVIKAKYSKYVTVSGDSAPYTWAMASGNVPTGLKLTYSGNKAKLSGTPTKSGTFKFTLTVTDKNNSTVTKTFTVKITKPSISGALADSTVKANYTGTLKVSGGTEAYTWAVSSGTLPNGLKLTYSDDKAVISGKPTKAGTFTFKIKATDANKAAVSKTFTINITKPEIAGTLANGKLKAKYSKSVTVNGGTESYKWTVSSGELPTGLKLTSSNTKATISGTPTKSGTFIFTLKVTDKNKATATKSFSIKITKPSISGTLPDGTVKTNYSATLKVSGGTSSYTWVKASGTLPKGLKLTSSNTKATISGTPTKAGTFTFKLKVTDANGATKSKSFTVKIAEASASDKDSLSKESSGKESSGKESSGKESSGKESTDEKSTNEKMTEKNQTENQNSLPENSPEIGENTDINLRAELKVLSEDIVETFDGKDSDIVKVKAGAPLRFTVTNWGAEVDDVVVYVDDKPLADVTVSDGKFTLPAAIVANDFKVGVKARSIAGKNLESAELYIIAE